MMEKCPHCGSTKLRKAGINRSGTQRYYCNSCHRKSSGDSTLIAFSKQNILTKEIECPYCHSYNVKKGGHLKSGAKRYYCNDCKKGFSSNTIIKEPIEAICTKCGSSNVKRCGHSGNKQRYLCNECSYKFVLNPTIREQKVHEVECPVCKHVGAVKAGVTGQRKQYYKCKKCNHKFLLNPSYVHTTSKIKHDILALYNKGILKKDIAIQLGISSKTVYKFTKGLIHKTSQDIIRESIINDVLHGCTIEETALKYNYENNSIRKLMTPVYKTEKLSDEQYEALDGYCRKGFKAEYIANKIKCSIYLCKKHLKEYKSQKERKMEKIKCSYCNGSNLKKSGYNKSGTQRYYCKDCERKFTPSFAIKGKINADSKVISKENNVSLNITCPYCHESNYKKSGLTRKGLQRYFCKSCKKRFVPEITPSFINMDEIKTIRNNIKELSCPYCESKNLAKFGMNEKNVQRYQCKDCKKTFLDHYEQSKRCGAKPPKEQLLKIIRQEYLSGKTKKEIAAKYGLCEKTIGTYTKGLKKDKTPLLFKSKKEKTEIRKALNEKVKKEVKEKQKIEKKVALEAEKKLKALKEQEEKRKREQYELAQLKKAEELRKEKENFKIELERRKSVINSIKFERRDLINELNINKLKYLFSMYLRNKITQEEFDKSFIVLKSEIEEQIKLSIEIEKSHMEYNIKKAILTGSKLTEVAKTYNIPIEEIMKKATEYYKTETISEHQKKLIIQYGIIMNTPVEYVAPYIPCSENMFYKVLAEYKDMKFNFGKIKLQDTQDDETILNNFIAKDKYIKAVD